jgi:hypothetical protein
MTIGDVWSGYQKPKAFTKGGGEKAKYLLTGYFAKLGGSLYTIDSRMKTEGSTKCSE